MHLVAYILIESENFEVALLSETFSIHCFRMSLSAIHYNENSDRLQEVTADGRPKYIVKYSKSKKGFHSLIPVKTVATYGSRFVTYCSLYNMNYLLNKCKEKRRMKHQIFEKMYLK